MEQNKMYNLLIHYKNGTDEELKNIIGFRISEELKAIQLQTNNSILFIEYIEQEKQRTISDIFADMDSAIQKFNEETDKIFADWRKRNQEIFDNYKKNVYDIEQRHKDLMKKIGSKI